MNSPPPRLQPLRASLIPVWVSLTRPPSSRHLPKNSSILPRLFTRGTGRSGVGSGFHTFIVKLGNNYTGLSLTAQQTNRKRTEPEGVGAVPAHARGEGREVRERERQKRQKSLQINGIVLAAPGVGMVWGRRDAPPPPREVSQGDTPLRDFLLVNTSPPNTGDSPHPGKKWLQGAALWREWYPRAPRRKDNSEMLGLIPSAAGQTLPSERWRSETSLPGSFRDSSCLEREPAQD